MKFIDTHSHLYSEQFDNDRSKVINDAISNGVETILLPNISSSYTKRMLDMCRQFPDNCYPMMGLHPCDVTEQNYDIEIAHVEEELAKGTYIGVGEIGLDLYWNKTALNIQKKAFIHQINLAKDYKLPIAIHVRDSFAEAIEIIEELNDDNLTGVFHCFTGNINDAERIIKLNDFYLGIGGVLTFKNSGLEKTIKNINIQNLILETDAPYLTPAPNRGKRNESKYIIDIAKKLAEIYNLSLKDIAKITSDNAKRIFKI